MLNSAAASASKLVPRRISHPSGAQVGIDGVAADNSILVQGLARGRTGPPAQRSDLLGETVKLFWIARALTPMPRRLIVCATDQAARAP